MGNNTTLAVIAIVAALAVLGVVMVTVATTMQLQQAEAIGCKAGFTAYNASQGRCFRG
jgi:UDP-N-acetylmuramyl pentapeptide phosphotransferase/UDP-N-acetylglucosamine-1-phosphate transferase